MRRSGHTKIIWIFLMDGKMMNDSGDVKDYLCTFRFSECAHSKRLYASYFFAK